MLTAIVEALSERRSREMWEAITETTEQANEMQAIEDANLQTAKIIADGPPTE